MTAPTHQIISVPSIESIVVEREVPIREEIVRGIRRKLANSNDLRDLRARDAEVVFHEDLRNDMAARVEIRWPIGTDPDGIVTYAAVFGRQTIAPGVPVRWAWQMAATDALKKLGV